MDPIPYARQSISPKDIEAITKAISGDWLTQGPAIDHFELGLADYCGAKHAVVVANGTAALHLACLSLKLNKDDVVVTSPITFAASANAVIYAGGVPAFVDVDESTWQLDHDKLAAFCEKNDRVRAVVAVDFAGLPTDLGKLRRVCEKYNLKIIVDAAHSLGGKWQDQRGNTFKVGDGQHAHLTTLSFHPAKQMTLGEGGAVLTNNADLAESIKLLRTHGITRNPKLFSRNDGGWYYEMIDLGFNYRITDFQCALGLSQLSQLDDFVRRRTEIVKRYDEGFRTLDEFRAQFRPTWSQMVSYHLYCGKFKDRDKLYDYLKQNKIFAQVHYIPVHLQPYYRERFGYKDGDFPVAENFYKQALSLPLYPNLTDDQQDYVIKTVRDFYA